MYVADGEAEVGHIVMLAAMAAMVGAPDSDLHRWWGWLFGALSVFYATRLLVHVRGIAVGSDGARLQAGGAAYHLVASLAMLYAATFGDHSGDHHGAHGSSGGALLWLGRLVGALFVADGLFTAVVLVSGRVPGSNETPFPLRARVALLPHLVMDVAMVAML